MDIAMLIIRHLNIDPNIIKKLQNKNNKTTNWHIPMISPNFSRTFHMSISVVKEILFYGLKRIISLCRRCNLNVIKKIKFQGVILVFHKSSRYPGIFPLNNSYIQVLSQANRNHHFRNEFQISSLKKINNVS